MVTSSTIDKIKDTTIMRMIRKMAGVIDEQNEVVESVQTQFDNFNTEEIQTQLNKNTGDISQLKISDTEHTSQISTLDTAVDTHAREITSLNTKTASLNSQISTVNNAIATINAKDNAQDAEIQGLSESVVSDLVATFDNSSRKLSLSIERESATPIDAVVTIPAGSTGGGSYSAGDGIAINGDNIISADVDGTTVKIQNGKLTSVGGQTYSAGNGIVISNGVISQTTRNLNNYVQKATTSDKGYCAIQFVESDATQLGKIQSNFSPTGRSTNIGCYNEEGNVFHNMGIRSLPKVEAYAPNPIYNTASDDAIIPKAGLVANFAPISLKSDVATIQTNLSTLETNVGKIGTSVNGCVNDISVSGNQMTVAKVNGQSNVITLPSAGDSKVNTVTRRVTSADDSSSLVDNIVDLICDFENGLDPSLLDYDINEGSYGYGVTSILVTFACTGSIMTNQKHTIAGSFTGVVTKATENTVFIDASGSFWWYKSASDKSTNALPLAVSGISSGNVVISADSSVGMNLLLASSINAGFGFSAVDWSNGYLTVSITGTPTNL